MGIVCNAILLPSSSIRRCPGRAATGGTTTAISLVMRDPLFGALFENMVVIDRLKSKYNAALPVDCYFYRDNIGNEVDLIEPRGAKVHAIEIKAGATINSD